MLREYILIYGIKASRSIRRVKPRRYSRVNRAPSLQPKMTRRNSESKSAPTYIFVRRCAVFMKLISRRFSEYTSGAVFRPPLLRADLSGALVNGYSVIGITQAFAAKSSAESEHTHCVEHCKNHHADIRKHGGPHSAYSEWR